MEVNNTRKLYDALKSDGYTDLGDFSSFEGKLKDSGKREMLYDVLKKDGWQDLGDFSQFESKLGYAPINNENIKETDYVSQSSVNPPPISLRQEVDIPKSDQSEYVNPWDNSADYNFESLRKKGKIETATPPPPTEYEKDSSFMNTWVGDAIQKLNAGGADLGAGIFGVLDKVSKGLESATGGLIPRGGAFKDISDRFKADAEFSRARSNRYNGKDFTDLWKEGNYMGAIGDIALQGVESLPMSIGAMAATMAGAPAAGLAGIGSIVASQKYDDLDQNNPNMGEFAKVSNAILTGTAESLSEMLGAGVSKAWMSTLFKTLGKEKAQEAIKRGIMGKMQEFYKKFGMFFEPVNEGIEEVSSTLAENITDKITGADPERDLTDGVLQSFVYGMGGGAYFTGAGALAKGAQYVADKIGGKQAQQPITDSNVTDQGVETPPLLTKSRFAEAEEEGRNMTDPGDIRTASKKMEETRLSLSGMVPGLASTIESYVDDKASEAQVMSLLDGVNADARPLAEDFYADYLRISGLQDRIGEEIDNEVETYVANNITPYVTTNPDGQSIVTTATLSEGNEERPVYVRSIEGDKAVISDNGQDRMVSVKRLSDIVEQDAGHMRRTYEDQLLATRQSELDMTMHHNPKTQLPKPGLIIWNGDNAFILQGQDENGDWIAQPAAYDRETGQVTAKNGSSPAMPITENEILDLQDAIYDAQQVNVVSPENDNVASADAKITSAPPVEDAINQPTSEIETEGAIDQIAQPSNVENPSMVMREDGTPDFVSSGTDMTLDFLHDKYGDKMPRKIEVTRKSFDESLKKASDALEKAQEAYDDAPIGKEDKAEAALIKARQEYEAIKVEADFWANLDDDIKEASKKPGDVIAKEISVMGDPMSGEELAAMMLANGAIKLTRDSYKKETGAGNNETARMFGLFASPEKGGVNIERAGEILELADRENGTNFFDENDTNAGRDAIIEVLSSAHTRGDLIDYVKRNREAIAERERQAEYNAYAEWCEENYHMSPEEYEAYEESMARDFSEKQLTDEERGELDSQIVDEIQAIIDEQNEIDAILAQNKPIENENIEGNDESGGDGLREGGGEVLPREQLDQTGGTGEVEGRESAGPDIDRTDGATQEGSSRGLVPFVAPSPKENETPLDYAERIVEAKRLHEEELKVDTNPTEAQKEAGNYKKGHIKINGFDVTIEQPAGSVRSGKDANGKEWSVTMNNTYGYIRGTESVDGDHIDVFLGPDMNSDMVYVVDQVNTDGSFDEHKVMMGFPSLEDARSAYLSNYEEGWQGLGNITGVALDEFKKWIDSSTRKTKPFYEYKGIKQEEGDISKNNDSDNYSIVPSQYTTKKGKVLDMRLLKFGNELSKEQQRAAKELAKAEKGWYDREQRGFMMRSDESARRLADTILGDTDAVSDAQPISLEDTRRVVEPQKVNVENLIGDINDKGKAKLSDRTVTPSGNRLVTDERYAELRERMRRKLGGQMNMGIDPEILAIGTEMAVYHIEKGLRKFSDYSKAMIDDLGDAIRPYLKAFYNGARDLPEVGDNGWDKDMTAYEDVRSFDVANFDKPVPDIMDAAETVVRETEIAGQASAAKKKIKNSRKKQTDNKDKPLPLYGNDLFTPNNIKDNEQGNSRADQGVGRKAREEDRGSERGGDRGGVHGSDVLDTERGRGIPISDSDKRPVVRNQNNFSFPEKGIELPSGDISKLKANIEAIETLKDVEDGQGKPTPEQQAKMSRYVGWGGLAEALNEGKYNARDNNWTKDRNWNDKYLRYYEKLKSLLSKEEFDSAVRSTTTSHYTPSEVVESLWGITEKLGFKGGNISEPAMGIGNIIGMMPKSISEKSSISGFEIDSLSGRMAKALYPDANIKVQGYEKAFSPNSKDLVITNVPFGKNAPYDKVLDKQFRKKLGSSYNLHNYFILKGLLELKEGGLGVFVTSSATMDGADSKFREYVSGNGYDLVGAIRLPNDAFQKGAGTSVTADIVIFRKRKYGEPSNGIGFTTTTQIGEGTYMEDGDKRSKPIMVNEYFSNHPDMMLGDMMTAYDAGSGGLYSGASQTLKAKPGADLSKELLNAIDNLPKNILSGVVETKGPEVVGDSTLKDGTITVQNGNVFVLDGDSLKPIKANPTFVHNGKTRKIADAVNDYNDIKKNLYDLIHDEQTKGVDPEPARKRLNKVYDAFVSKYGTLNRNKALDDIFAEDVEHGLPFSLETVRRVPSTTGKSMVWEVSKADGILNKRVSYPFELPTKADNVLDAVNISKSYKGNIDIPYISEITGMDEVNVTNEILEKGIAYRDPVTGEIVIVSPNSTSVGDAQRTFLHEVVGHHGLRELFGDDFDTFLDNVYRNANEDIRKNIIDRTKGNPLNLREATEEYIAELAERGFDNKAERSLWEKIKDSFLDMLRKAGISLDFKLSDNDLRYILWRSYKNLEQGNLMDVAEDIVMRNRLSLNNINLNENGSIARDIEPEKGKQPSETKGTGRELETIDGVDENGNESERDHIDKPRGVENAIDGIKNATDRNGKETDGQVDNYGDQLDGGDTGDRNGSVRDGIDGERTVIGRAGAENKGRGVGESVREKTDDFAFAEKTIRFRENARNESVLFADNDIQVVEKQVGSAKDQYERTLSTSSYQFQEAFQDSMLGLKTLQDAVAKATRSRILDYENAYMAENALSSVNEAEFNAYRKAAFEPILKAISRLEKMGSSIDEIRDYLITKHGIERNREMAVKRALSQNAETYKSLLDEYIGRRNEIRENGGSWEEQQSEMDRLAEEYGANLSDDFSGFTSMYPNEDNTGYDPDSARRYVLDYESRYDTSELSASVKRATDAILAKQRDSGLMSQNTFESISDMYQFYVPLRGWEETTADEVYAYLTSESQTFNAPIKTVVGRKSKADDPIATIANMAESGIMQGNRNLMKQKFLTMVQNHKTDLVSVSEMWVRLDEASGEWIAVFPDIPSNANPEQVESIVESFNKRMEELSNEKGSNVRRSRDAIGIPYKILPKDLKEHQVIVKRAGKEYVLTINGNPRAAQALNGLTNPDNTKGWFGTLERYAGWLNRNLAANFTTRNPNFMVSNFLRDALYSNTTVWVKESPVYAWKFNKNFAMVNPINMYRLVKGYENGTLDMSDPLNKAYHDFVMRGGETGYTNLRDVEAKKKAIQKELQYSKQKVSIGKALKILGEWMDLFNKSVENCARFAAFLTSREMGRSMDKSIYDAKEISVNFNKKGAGSKFLNTEGQTKIGNASAFTSGLSRSMYVFWNAGVQGMYNFGSLAKDNPKKFLGLASSFYLLGTIMPMIAAAFGDDEDDDYYDLPEYVRRNNICFRNGGGNWITIPMPIELRAIYGLGEMSSGIVSGKEKYTDKKMAMKIAEQMSQVLPLDMMEGGGGFSAFVPSSVKPLIEAGDNKDWTGLPLYKDNDFNKGMPEWTKAFKSVDLAILAMTKYANELTGGDKYTTGTVNLNPAIIEHILDGYFGGIEATRSQMVKSAETAWGSRDFDWRNIPVGNRLIKSGDERTKKKAIDNAYYENLEEMEKIGQRLRGYRKELSNPQNDSFDMAEYQKKLNDLMMSDEYRRYIEFNNLNKLYQSMGEYLKKVDDEILEMELYDLKAMMNEIANGK